MRSRRIVSNKGPLRAAVTSAIAVIALSGAAPMALAGEGDDADPPKSGVHSLEAQFNEFFADWGTKYEPITHVKNAARAEFEEIIAEQGHHPGDLLDDPAVHEAADIGETALEGGVEGGLWVALVLALVDAVNDNDWAGKNCVGETQHDAIRDALDAWSRDPGLLVWLADGETDRADGGGGYDGSSPGAEGGSPGSFDGGFTDAEGWCAEDPDGRGDLEGDIGGWDLDGGGLGEYDGGSGGDDGSGDTGEATDTGSADWSYDEAEGGQPGWCGGEVGCGEGGGGTVGEIPWPGGVDTGTGGSGGTTGGTGGGDPGCEDGEDAQADEAGAVMEKPPC